MDPNETLRELRALDDEGNSDEALMMFHALDDWLSAGGFLPDDWRKAERRHLGPPI